ncbi:lytic transglycosylase domain-containing protein [Seohaeicola saemankumensis]|nr:lytic transglycosylase domain-containing protein [Seohaeicola saemankumensis]MCA0870920.1 lytic transglycosylase domain-containing protein [Seohaeicola saemankumensis]
MLRAVAFGLSVAVVCAGGPAGADSPAPFPDFKPRFVKPPKPGAKRKAIVQIDPTAVAQQPVARTPEAPDAESKAQDGTEVAAAAPVGNYGWFWDKISPELTSSGPGRLRDALSVLSGSGTVGAPRLQAMQDIAQARGIPILTATVGTEVSPALVLAMIAVESSGRADVTSSAGAQGLMQLMPDTAARFGVTDAMKPEENIAGGVKYLNWLMGEFDNDPILVLAGYNAGEGAVRSHKGVPPYAETRDYVPKVLAAFQVAKGLCKTPPELISDGCVFAAMN